MPDSVEGMLILVGVGVGDELGLGVADGDGDGDGLGDGLGLGDGEAVGIGVAVDPDGVDSKPGSPAAACTTKVLVSSLKKPVASTQLIVIV